MKPETEISAHPRIVPQKIDHSDETSGATKAAGVAATDMVAAAAAVEEEMIGTKIGQDTTTGNDTTTEKDTTIEDVEMIAPLPGEGMTGITTGTETTTRP